MPTVRLLLLLASIVCLTSCLDYETRIQVRPDGSGQIIETALFSKKAIAFMKNLRSKEEKQDKPFSLFDEEKQREKVSKYGEGVTYVSGKTIEKNGMEGYTVTYAFTDINTLALSKNSLQDNMRGGTSNNREEHEEDDPADKFHFSFTKGSPATLVISALPEHVEENNDDIVESDTTGDSDASEMAMAMLKPFMEGMKVRILVEPQGTITKTNAHFVEGSTITVMSLDLDKVLESEENTKRLFKEGTPKDKKANWNALMKDIPGVQGQIGEIQVQFK